MGDKNGTVHAVLQAAQYVALYKAGDIFERALVRASEIEERSFQIKRGKLFRIAQHYPVKLVSLLNDSSTEGGATSEFADVLFEFKLPVHLLAVRISLRREWTILKSWNTENVEIAQRLCIWRACKAVVWLYPGGNKEVRPDYLLMKENEKKFNGGDIPITETLPFCE